MTKQVVFEAIAGTMNDLVDGAYKVKYGGSPYSSPMIDERRRAATVKVTPR